MVIHLNIMFMVNYQQQLNNFILILFLIPCINCDNITINNTNNLTNSFDEIVPIISNNTVLNSNNETEVDQIVDTSDQIAVPVIYSIQNHHVWRKPQPFENQNSTTSVTPIPQKILATPILFSYNIRPDQNSAPTLQYFGTKGYYEDLLKNKTAEELALNSTTVSENNDHEVNLEPEDLQDVDYSEEGNDSISETKEDHGKGDEQHQEEISDDDDDEEEEENTQEEPEDDTETDNHKPLENNEEEIVEDEPTPLENIENSEDDRIRWAILSEPTSSNNKSTLTKKSFPHDGEEYKRLLENTQQMHNDLLTRSKNKYQNRGIVQPDEDSGASEIDEKHKYYDDDKISKKKRRKPKYRIIRIYDDDDDDDEDLTNENISNHDQLNFHHHDEDFKQEKDDNESLEQVQDLKKKVLNLDDDNEYLERAYDKKKIDNDNQDDNDHFERVHPKFRSKVIKTNLDKSPSTLVKYDLNDDPQEHSKLLLCAEELPPKKRKVSRKPKYRPKISDFTPEEAESRGHVTTIKVTDSDSTPKYTKYNGNKKPTLKLKDSDDNQTEDTKHEAKKAKKAENTKFKKGGGKEHDAEHYSKHGEKGEKSYKGSHKHVKGEKGHHDKEGHKGNYDDKGGSQKKHHHEDGHFAGHKKGEKGEKGAKFAEHGKHEKGHSTKGEHNIHKKDEYEKKHEFFDEYNEGGESEKHGGFHQEHEGHKGGSQKGGHHKSGYDHGEHGKKGKKEEGGHYHEEKGHKSAAGHDDHYDHESKFGKKSGHDDGKKWTYKKKG